MDPISAIGVAAAVVQFVQFGLQVAKTVEEFNRAHPGDVPKSLQAISLQLPLLVNSLNRIKTDSEVKNLDVDTKCILRGVISGCHSQVAVIEAMMNELSRTPGDNFKTKLKKVFKSLNYDEKLWAVERNLNTYISVLILHHVVDSKDLPPPAAADEFFDVREGFAESYVERPKLINELDRLFLDATRSRARSPIFVTLVGPKDVGKSQLALGYCHHAHSLGQFKTVFWVDASSVENLGSGFESMYATITRATSGTRQDKVSFVRDFLSDLWHPWLLVLDHYDHAALYNDIIEMLPSRGTGGIMFIARSQAKRELGSVLEVPKYLSASEQAHVNSLLIEAVQGENTHRIKELVEQGADVDTLIWDQWPCLHRCALLGLDDSVELLLNKGANLDPPPHLRSSLYWAASNGHETICRILLDHEDQTGRLSKSAEIQAAFDAAAENGSLSIMHLLADRRAASMNSGFQYGVALRSAAKKGHAEVLGFLIAQGALKDDHVQAEHAVIEAAYAGNFEPVKILCNEGVNPNCRDTQGQTVLCHAAGLKDHNRNESGLEMAEFLLMKGADPNLVGSDGPIHRAAIHEHVKMLYLLLKHGADPTKDCQGWDPLTNAIKYKSPESVTVLLQAEIKDKEARAQWLNCGLRYACRQGDREAVLQLLTAGSDIDAAEENGFPKGATPLLLAVLNGHVKTAQLLVRRGAKQDVSDQQGRFPLPAAAELGFDTLVRDLIRAGGDPNIKSGANQDTPLMLAAGKKHNKVVKVLLENGADKMLANKFGDIALDVAEEGGHKETIEMLEG